MFVIRRGFFTNPFERNLNPINKKLNSTKEFSFRLAYLLQGRFFRCQQKRYKALSRNREKKEEKQLINLLERKTNIRLEIIQIMFGTDKDIDAQMLVGGVGVFNKRGAKLIRIFLSKIVTFKNAILNLSYP